MKRILITMVAMIVMATISAQTTEPVPPAKPTFGYADYSALLTSMPEYAEAQKSLDLLRQSYDKEMQRSEQNFSKQYSEYIDGQKTFPENILLKRQKELQQLMEQSLQFKNEAERLLSKAEEELMQPLRQKLNQAIQTVGRERGYQFILNTENNTCPFINPDMGEDATPYIKKKL